MYAKTSYQQNIKDIHSHDGAISNDLSRIIKDEFDDIVNHRSFSVRNFCGLLYLQQESPLKTFLVGDNRYNEKVSLDYSPLKNAEKQIEQKRLYNSIELLAYQILINQHAYEGLQNQNNSLSYLVSNSKYTVTATEGYVHGIGYLTLSISNQYEELQRYTLMLKHREEREGKIKIDENIKDSIDELLVRLSSDKGINTEDVLQIISKVIGNRAEQNMNLSISSIELKQIEKVIKSEIISEDKDKIRAIILQVEIEKNIKLNQLLIRKNTEQKGEVVESTGRNLTTYLPSYIGNIAEYLKRLEKKRRDFTNLAPLKNVQKFPVNMMGGVLGFTYLGENFMGIRDDLYGPELHEVELHESIHTSDEYETRVLTKWMLENETKYH